MTNNLDIYQINTTAWDEEDFLLLTSLTPEQITEVIQPIVNNERENDVEYDNGVLFDALKKAYPNDTITQYIPIDIELISI
jgi:hypothetical protein